MAWTTDEESAFLYKELPAFKALKEESGNLRYGRIKRFINDLYTRFTAAFPLKDHETSKKKIEVSFVSTSRDANF